MLLLGLLCVSVIVPLLALETVLLVEWAAKERARHEAVARDGARRIAVSLDRALATLGAIAEVLATSDHLLRDDLAAFRRRLRQMPRLSEAGVVLRDAAGNVLLVEGAAHPAARDPATEAAALLTGRPHLSGLLRDDTTGHADFAVVAPVGGAPERRLLSLRVPAAELHSLLARDGVPDGMAAIITDRGGAVIARTQDAPQLSHLEVREDPTEGWLTGTDAGRDPIVMAYARSEVAGWTAWVIMPERDFAAPLRRSLAAAAAIAVLVLGLAVLVALVFARRIAKPITDMAEAVRAGDEVATATPILEINQLAAAYAAARTEAARLRGEQAELRRMSRVNDMGALAAALAHEINQPLTAATAFAEGALRLMPAAPTCPRLAAARDAMREAASQAVRAGRIVGRLRAFLGASDGEKLPTDVNTLVKDAVELALTDAHARGVRLRYDLAPELPSVRLDRVQIGQVVVNLVRNAMDAMANTDDREVMLTTRHCGDAGTIEVVISDTGPGVSPCARAGLFRPFVTTKRGGMGVGLAISRGIVEDHGGRLEYLARRERGAAFRFTLPIEATAAEVVTEAPAHAG